VKKSGIESWRRSKIRRTIREHEEEGGSEESMKKKEDQKNSWKA